jgi:hypothetical protein
MKRNVYLNVTLVGLLCGVGLAFTMGAHTASSEKNAFTPDAVPYGPAPAFVRQARNSRCSRATPAPPAGITPCA